MGAERHLHAVSGEPANGPDAAPRAGGGPSGAAQGRPRSGTAGPGSLPTSHRDGRNGEIDVMMQMTGRGSAAAFERLYDAISGSVFGVALRVVRDPELAEDVAQEVMLEVWNQAPRYRVEAGSARGWILTIAQRRAVDRVRSEQSHTDRLRTQGAKAVVAGEAAPTPQDQAVDTMYAEWEAVRVRAGMAALTELQREALELAYYKGYTHREVSEALDVPLGTAKARLRDGLIKLRDVLGGEER